MRIFGLERRDVGLIYNFFVLNVRDKYLGSRLGSVWAIANPLCMLGIFTFVFGFVYKAKLPGADTTLAYVTWLISGYGPWIALSEALMAGTMSVVSASGLVKNLAFKTEILPLAAVATGGVPLTVSLVFLTILLVADGSMPSWHVAWIPLVILLQFFFIAAIALWLSAITVFVRDISFVLPSVLTVLMFAIPVFYALDMMPQVVRRVSEFNPLYIIVEGYRQPLIHHASPSAWGLAYVFGLSLVIFYSGMKAFRRVKGNFEGAL
ncbi:ABC transporter permease [Bordetella bronchiseptica]|uniref:ABC transporter permease n=1 Tax=Bordetella bronchiseptica TaxID=518 RepID=UPI000F678FFD|nr:ABC transporter permease [Bordetella bronchiseptica]RSB97783.1 ABC transporter permease [Bordetella bronchiseptica]RSC06835.1 ABC transporter permease [Bordetella bronchiseptica]